MPSATFSRLAGICVGTLLALLTAVSHSADTRQHRIVPLRPLTGEPFVMRIRELPGTIIPPHKHPVDEHITVIQLDDPAARRYSNSRKAPASSRVGATV
jgi:hypothetical protein